MSDDVKPEGGELSQVDAVPEDKDIQDNEVKYDSDGAARSIGIPPRPPSSNGSVASSGSGSKGKRRTWKKPKDKPKRPLSAYNIFFKHERSRIVEGFEEEATPEEVIRSIEGILSTSRETRRHRRTHGRISFGDLARKIAEKWKSIGGEQKAVFEHYAELDMRRYRKEVKAWKEKKENEALAKQSGMDGGSIMNNSFSSLESEADMPFDQLTGSNNSDEAWAPRRNFYDSMNSSFSSANSIDSEISLEPIPIGDILRRARPNIHASMPNLSIDDGIPGFVSAGDSSNIMGNQMDQPMAQFGQQSLSNMYFNPNQTNQMDNLSPPLIISSTPDATLALSPSLVPEPLELQQLREQNNLQQQQIQRQQQILLRQQQLLQQQLQQTRQMMGGGIPSQLPQSSNSLPVGNIQNTLGDGAELENYLSNLDLSNM